MGKAFIINGIDASGFALKQVTPVYNMTDVTKDLIIHPDKMFLHYPSEGHMNELRRAVGQTSFVLDVSAYVGKKLFMYIPSQPVMSAWWRVFVQSFTSPITASDWSSVNGPKKNALVPSASDPYIGGEHTLQTIMVWKEVIVPADANYIVVSYDSPLADQVKVYVEP